MGLDRDQTQLAFWVDERLFLDYVHNEARLDSRQLDLTHKEYDLLVLLVQHAGRTIPREILLMQIWGYSAGVRTRTLDVHIRRLRKKLGSYQHILTVFRIGYRFQPSLKQVATSSVTRSVCASTAGAAEKQRRKYGEIGIKLPSSS